MAALTILKDADFRKQIKTSPALGYLFFGEEDYLKELAVRHARQTLGSDASFACFNEIIIDALDYAPDVLRNALLPLPLMAARKVVLLRGMDINSLRPSELDALCETLTDLQEYDYNTLLLPVASGALDEGFLPKRPSPALQRLCEVLTPVQYERCTPAKLCGWCIRHFEHNGVRATSEDAAALIESCGRNMLTLASEIDKISYYILSHGRNTLTREDMAHVACTTSEYDTFAFTNALMEYDMPRALDVLADLKFRRVDPLFILGEVIRVGCDMLAVLHLVRQGKTNAEIGAAFRPTMHEYKVSLYRKSALAATEEGIRRIIAACQTADRALKLSPQGYAALDTLICSL